MRNPFKETIFKQMLRAGKNEFMNAESQATNFSNDLMRAMGLNCQDIIDAYKTETSWDIGDYVIETFKPCWNGWEVILIPRSKNGESNGITHISGGTDLRVVVDKETKKKILDAINAIKNA